MVSDIKVSDSSAFSLAAKSWKVRLMWLPILFRMIAIALLITILAEPRSSSVRKDVVTEGIDIVISLDVSGSMLAEDFKPNRLEAAKKTAIDFIGQRSNDRLGVVVFAGESFTQCPLTVDHDVLKNIVSKIETGKLKNGTAIGMGLATAVSRLKESKAKSKVAILLTDGVNNTGIVTPETAAEIAEKFKIRCYTIGVGTNGTAPVPVQHPIYGKTYQQAEVQIDEDLLKEISKRTGGKYFRATNNKSLEDIYKEIDKLEKTKIDETSYEQFAEEYMPFAIAAGILLMLEFLLNYTVFRKNP
jgi:Ca-activated chloride channel family protein